MMNTSRRAFRLRTRGGDGIYAQLGSAASRLCAPSPRRLDTRLPQPRNPEAGLSRLSDSCYPRDLR